MPVKNKRLCGAQARQNKNLPCRQPSMENGRCRLHGGKATGAKTLKGKIACAQANLKHGLYTHEAIVGKKRMRMIMNWRNEF